MNEITIKLKKAQEILKGEQSYWFNPYEICICGYSRTGKTVLISKLIQKLSSQYKIGYIKHDAHSFEMDHEGKDSFLARQAGARTVFISDADHFAQIHSGEVDDVLKRNMFLDNDCVFIEGYKDSPLPKLILIDEKTQILNDIKDQRFKNIAALVGQDIKSRDLPAGYMYFHRDDIEGIKQCVLSHFNKISQEIPLVGLVLAGGESTRMKKDKSLLEYHGRTQVEFCYDLLSGFCREVFVSNRKDQAALPGHAHRPQLHDTFLNIGPLGGILSALTHDPKAAWLVIACDLPFVNPQTIEALIQNRNPFKTATAYQSTNDNLPEPLCTIYEPKSIIRLLQFLGQGVNCPRKILMKSDIQLIQPKDRISLENINRPEEYKRAVEVIKEEQSAEESS